MEKIVCPLNNLDQVQSPFSAELCEFPEYVSEFDQSIIIHIPQGSKGSRIHILAQDDSGATDIAISAQSFKCPVRSLYKAGQACYGVSIDEEVIEIPMADFDTITIPYQPFDSIDIVVLTDEEDTIILSNLRVVTDELPQDILNGFTKIELPHYPIGNISVIKGQRKIQLPDITNIVEGAVIGIGDHRHQIKGLVGDLATLEDTEDGEQILEDFEGTCFLETPVKIGYYDQDLKLPSVVIWFTSPTPDLRAVRREEYKVFGNEIYVKERTQFEEWTVRLEVVGGSPELVQAVATKVRLFLERNRIWINGKKFTFEWTESAIDTEPSSYLDIQPSVAYNIKISLQEEYAWQTVQKGSGKLKSIKFTQET